MKIASFDVGIKNLAFCILSEDFFIHEWKILDISANNIEEVANKLYSKLNEISNLWEDINIVLIENQPVLKNPKMKSIQMLLYGYFQYIKYSGNIERICLVSAKSKMNVKDVIKCTKYKSNYSNTKASSVLTAQHYIETYCSSKLNIFENTKKKDDLSDCYLQGVYFIQSKK